MESIPNKTEEKSLVEKINGNEKYRFYGFDNFIDETPNNLKSSNNMKSSFVFDDQMNGLKNSGRSTITETNPKLEANLKNV